MNDIQNRQCHSNNMCCVCTMHNAHSYVRRDLFTKYNDYKGSGFVQHFDSSKSYANGLEFCKFVLKLDPNNTTVQYVAP